MSAPPVPEDEELPGEAAALAAFRKVRADRAPDADPAFSPGRAAAREPVSGDEPGFPHRPAPAPGEDTGLVRIGGPVRSYGRRLRPRLRRPVRLGLAAALTVGMVGGVAAAAGTGLLPTPFDDAEPGPAASASAAVTPGPDRPLGPPTPGTSPGGTGPALPDGGTRGTSAPGPDGPADDLAASCREKGAGRALAAERRHALERAAGGSARVPAYCAGLLGDREGQDPGEPNGGKATDEGGVDIDGDEQGGGRNGGQNGGRSAGQSGGTTGKGSESRGGKKNAESEKTDKGEKGEKADKGEGTGKSAEKAGKGAAKESAKKDGKGAEAP